MNLLRCLPFALLLGNVLAQDLVQISPAFAKVEYEDANIRVVRSHYERAWFRHCTVIRRAS